MTNFYRFLFPILDSLLRNQHTFHITIALILGIWCGFFPMGTLQWICSFLSVLILRINLLAFISTLVPSIVLAEALTPLWNSIGFRFLTHHSELYPMWGWMHHAPVIPYTSFNNTVVLGQTFFGLLLSSIAGVTFIFFSKPIRHMISALWYRTKASRFYAHYRRN